MLTITRFQFNMFGENTYLLADEATSQAAVVDPGMFYPEEFKAFDKFISDHQLQLTQIINTHLHLDHCFGANYVSTHYGARLAAHDGDAVLGATIGEQSRRFGIREAQKPVEIDIKLHQGDRVAIGSNTLTVLHVPGHSPGGIALYCEAQHFVLVGDSLFQGSVGRTDLPGGDHTTLIESIRRRLLTLPGDTTVLPGHGEPTTIAAELRSNPFLR